ncbi:uncharacterized protein LOC111276143 [Durio zibethinus]|uniref:Uncharacterized protein LOC111276143 n=1 Tax=Durio zibethinus TaxID=66656 RepID=A0A6P5WNV2_DURZI|nr:uncharacterized protein LOC111276143 [Durio zibethinus]
MAQELVKGHDKTTLSSRCAIKIDLKKAFDVMNWAFLILVLKILGFSEKYIGWIKSCLITPKYLLFINGGLVRYFEGARESCKETNVSYLFVIIMNLLSRLLDFTATHGVFSYHLKCKKARLTHLSSLLKRIIPHRLGIGLHKWYQSGHQSIKTKCYIVRVIKCYIVRS